MDANAASVLDAANRQQTGGGRWRRQVEGRGRQAGRGSNRQRRQRRWLSPQKLEAGSKQVGRQQAAGRQRQAEVCIQNGCGICIQLGCRIQLGCGRRQTGSKQRSKGGGCHRASRPRPSSPPYPMDPVLAEQRELDIHNVLHLLAGSATEQRVSLQPQQGFSMGIAAVGPWLTSLMSSPRAATSVQTRIGTVPALNASTAAFRIDWFLSPWQESQFLRAAPGTQSQHASSCKTPRPV